MSKPMEQNKDVKTTYHYPTPEAAFAAQTRAWDMRVKAYTFAQIGKALGLSASNAYVMVCKHREYLKAESMETAEQLRDMEISKLDAAENRLWEALDQRQDLTVDQISKAAEKIVKISESRRKLTGLDAPQKVELGGNIYTVQATSPECPEWGEPPKPPEKKEEVVKEKELTSEQEEW